MGERKDICDIQSVINGPGSMCGTQGLVRKIRNDRYANLTRCIRRCIDSKPLCHFLSLCEKQKITCNCRSGALAWLVALIRSPILHFTYLFAGSPSIPPLWFIGLGAILAGVFEEGFRYIFLKSSVEGRTWYNGVAFGLGAGLLEIILIYCIPMIKTVVFGQESLTLLETLPGSVERNFAVCAHIGCALLVMHSLKNRWMLGMAVLYHSLLDFIAPTLRYYSPLTVWQVEFIVAIFAVMGLIIAYLEKRVLSKMTT